LKADEPLTPVTHGGGQVFVYERGVRFDEVDAAQILFFARFFNYCHEAMETFFSQLPGGYVALINERKIGLPAVHVEGDFKSPLRFGDIVRIDVTLTRVGRSSCSFRHAMSHKATGAAVALVHHICAAVELATLKPIAIPGDMRTLLERYLPTA
jgi:4-hydroxybenzoyl-CoA thioesterase